VSGRAGGTGGTDAAGAEEAASASASGGDRAAQRIGLFGGTFDPPHLAHLALARKALDALRLDEVRWIPAGTPWQKDRAITPAADRAAMVALAIEGEPRFVLDRCELDRDGPSYTIDTVRTLRVARPAAQLFLLVGQDQYAGLHTWHGWRELLQSVVLAVANRPGAAASAHPDVVRCPHRVVPLPMLEIAATDIRARAARGDAIDHLVPPGVARYIARHRLYRDA
jgi:nicotinate-nucleotide adenylyltransferase